MIFTVTDTYPTITLIGIKDTIAQPTFIHLTGKNIDLQKRLGKTINTIRTCGHLYIEDQVPIKGETYVVGGKYFICKYVDEKGVGLLSAEDNSLVILNLEGPLQLK